MNFPSPLHPSLQKDDATREAAQGGVSSSSCAGVAGDARTCSDFSQLVIGRLHPPQRRAREGHTLRCCGTSCEVARSEWGSGKLG